MEKLNYTLLDDSTIRKLALIVLQSDVTIEDEFRYYFHDADISLLCNRIPFENEVSVERLKAMEGHLVSAMSLFPIDDSYKAVGYACTSASLHIGSDRIKDIISSIRKTDYVTDPMSAAILAMQSINARKIAYLAPYSPHIAQTMVDEFTHNGIGVEYCATFDEPQDRFVGLISPRSIYDAALSLKNKQDIDAVFLSCTNMKCAQIIPQIEDALGIYAMSSNQALAWHMAKIANLEINPQKGKLFSV